MFASSSGYIAGFVDPEVGNRSDLFDVYVSLPDSVITVSQSAKGTVSSKEQPYVKGPVICKIPLTDLYIYFLIITCNFFLTNSPEFGPRISLNNHSEIK